MKEEPLMTFDDSYVTNKIVEICRVAGENGITNSVLQQSISDVAVNQRVKALNSLLSTGQIELLQLNNELIYRLKKEAIGSTRNDCLQLETLQEKIIYSAIEESESNGITIAQIRDKTKLQLQLIKKVVQNFEKNKSICSFSHNENKVKYYILPSYVSDAVCDKNALFKDGNIDKSLMEYLTSQIKLFFIENNHNGQSQISTLLSDNTIKYALKYHTVLDVYTDLNNKFSISERNIKVNDIGAILETLYFDNILERKVDPTINVNIEKNNVPKTITSLQMMYIYRSSNILMQSTIQTSNHLSISHIDVPFCGMINVPCNYCSIAIHCHESNDISPENCPFLKSWADLF